MILNGRFTREMDRRYELEETITVCLWPDCSMHKIDDSLWVYHKKKHGYDNYSHGLCPTHYKIAIKSRKLKPSL